MRTVVIVKEGELGKGAYDAWIGLISRAIEEAEEENYLTGKKEKAVRVELVETITDALERLERGGVNALVFVSRIMLSQARKVKGQYPWLRVVLSTGLIPDDEVVLVGKGWALTSGQIRRIIL